MKGQRGREERGGEGGKEREGGREEGREGKGRRRQGEQCVNTT